MENRYVSWYHLLDSHRMQSLSFRWQPEARVLKISPNLSTLDRTLAQTQLHCQPTDLSCNCTGEWPSIARVVFMGAFSSLDRIPNSFNIQAALGPARWGRARRLGKWNICLNPSPRNGTNINWSEHITARLPKSVPKPKRFFAPNAKSQHLEFKTNHDREAMSPFPLPRWLLAWSYFLIVLQCFDQVQHVQSTFVCTACVCTVWNLQNTNYITIYICGQLSTGVLAAVSFVMVFMPGTNIDF